MENQYYEVGWRLTREQRKAIKEKGYHVYATRSWDTGYGSTLEHYVLVNHETDVITNFAALNDDDPEDRADDFYEHMEKFDATGDLDVSGLQEILDY